MRIDREWRHAAVLGTAHGAQHFLSGLLPPLIPLLAIAFQYPLWQLGLLASLYSLVGGLGQAPMGVLSDRHDRRWLLPPGLALMALGYVTFGFAPALGASLPSIELLNVRFEGPFVVMASGMMVTGLGSSAVHPTGYPLVSANVRASRKGRALGIWGSASKFGDTVSPIAVAVLVLVLPWEQVLVVLGGVGLVYAVVLFGVLGRTTIETRPPGAVTADATDGSAADPDAGTVLTDRRSFVYPMLAVVVLFVARGVTTKGVRTFVPTFVTDVYGYSLTLFGTTIGPTSLANVYFSALLFTAAIVQLIAGGLTDRYDHRKVIVAMFVVSGFGLLVLSYVTLSPLALLVTLLVVGGSLWGANPARDTLVSDISPAEWEGRTFGYLWTFSQAMSAASPVLVGYVADLAGIQDSFKYLALATFLGAGAAAVLLSPRVYVETDAETAANPD